jgi:peptide/nickel transport system substrate-binding protein
MTDNTPEAPSILRGGPLDRRKFLWSAAAGLAAVGAGASLVACAGGGRGGGQTSAGPTGEAKGGGTLRLGAQGGASTDTLDGQNGLTNADFNRIYQLYDQLVVLDAQGQPQFSLAKSITPNNDGTEWTIVIPDGVTTHPGKPFTADDVVYSFNWIVE